MKIQGYQTHNCTVIIAIACSAILHWAIMQWITIAVSTSQRPAMGLSLSVVTAFIAPPESRLENQDFVTEFDSLKNSITGKIAESPIESDTERIPGPINLITNSAKYFSNHEVDVAAIPVFTPPLLFPERAYISRLSGKVRVRVFISETGLVDSVEAVETTPPHQPFTDSAITSVQNTTFSPAIVQGRKVRSQKLIEIIFNAEEDKPEN